MALDVLIGGANLDVAGNLKAALPTAPAYVGHAICVGSVDDGAVTAAPENRSIDVDEDYKIRTNIETHIDAETFDYTAQNTGKHNYVTTTLTMVWSAAGLQSNGAGITTTTTGAQVRTYATFPLLGATQLYHEMELSISNQPTTNTLVDFGGGIPGAANPFTPSDGAFFRLNSNGINGIINFNGTETQVGPFAFTEVDGSASYTNNKKYQFIIQTTQRRVIFYIDNVFMGSIDTPVGQGQPFMAMCANWFFRHAIVGGAAGAALSVTINSYTVSIGGPNFADNMGTVGNRIYGSYQGLSGGTMGSLANFANSANPTAFVPTNTTAALGTGLGGQFLETDTLAVNTDGIIMSFQVPAATVNAQGHRLKLNGFVVDSFVFTALTGGGYNAVWSLAFGHTAVSLATAEASGTKAPRRIPIGSNSVASAAAVLTQLPRLTLNLQNAVFVNPSEFIAIVKKKVGTAPSAGAIFHTITPDYSWE